MRRRRNLLSDHEVTREIWPSFTDVMSTMALILFVLVLLAFVQNLSSGRRLDAFRHQISASEERLRSLEEDVRRTTTEIEAGKARLQDQERVIDTSNQELANLRARLQGIAVLRVEVLNKLKRAIEAELRPAQSADAGELVLIGDNGNIVINESLVFEFNSYALKTEAKPLLDTLARALGNLLADANVRENIDAIVIQGHTDERGSASLNWDLSARRANSVLDYLFETNRTLPESYGNYFAASAFSKFRPLNPAKNEAAYQQNRRIEISVVPKDDNIRKVIDDYMQSLDPNSPPPALKH